MDELIELLSRPWALMPDRIAEITASIVRAMSGVEQFTSGPVEKSTRPKTKGVAVIPIAGVITPRSDWWGTSVRTIRNEFRKALADDSVDSILLQVDSPGGSVFNVDELSQEIFEARGRKPVVAVADSLAASAAYYLASAADQLYMTPSGLVGSIGVYTAHVDWSQMLSNDGIKVTLISAGKYKVEGNPYEPLTDEARAAIQKDVDRYYSMFVGAVSRNRNVPKEAIPGGFGEGRVVGAGEAVAGGMVDGVRTFDQALTAMLENAKPKSNIFQVRFPNPPPEPLPTDAAECCNRS